MGVGAAALAARMQHARTAAGVSHADGGHAIGVSSQEYRQLEAGTRPLRADELIVLADHFGVRAGVLTGLPGADTRVHSTHEAGSAAPEGGALRAMRAHLLSYLELDAYLAGHGVA